MSLLTRSVENGTWPYHRRERAEDDNCDEHGFDKSLVAFCGGNRKILQKNTRLDQPERALVANILDVSNLGVRVSKLQVTE